ncbi:dual CXXC motif small (seleno)protein [Desulfocurvus sp.]|jgi:ribosomal protein L37AE/L43A|uniref:dual CXXC motif small (seleno)protein n=1 Tax=Desulfocurvus sp. TaxID=2871698 RepID=UPI0025C1EA56|nr:dual CXXC motif small (seleno)protein [Desulfocurvus sp.]MCK9239857.1 hypothetical protein [Desulfocurvus sp.]
MWNTPTLFGGPRQADARMACKECQGSLRVIRSCREVYLFCGQCGGKFKLDAYAEYLDQIEEFMLNIPCDRI